MKFHPNGWGCHIMWWISYLAEQLTTIKTCNGARYIWVWMCWQINDWVLNYLYHKV
jgi:hypothetical protein